MHRQTDRWEGTHTRALHIANTLADEPIARTCTRTHSHTHTRTKRTNAHSHHQIRMRTHTHACRRYELYCIHLNTHGGLLRRPARERARDRKHFGLNQRETEPCETAKSDAIVHTRYNQYESVAACSRSSRRMSNRRAP